MTLNVKLISEYAKLPVRSSEGAAGYDLSSSEDKIIPGHGWILVSTGISVELPPGTYGRVAPRSGLSTKGICVGAGVIDADYKGTVGVLLYNHGKDDFEVKIGHRIAQLILEQIVTPDVVQINELSETTRGCNGFGSTGI